MEEVDTLKSYVIDLKSRIPNFVPYKGDEVDKSLAAYINALPNRQQMKIMFIRLSPGVYEFGTMRVHIEVKREKILVKVGGGTTGIDEFLELYTSSELEKFEKRDPLAHVSERTLEEKIVGRSNTSPTRRQQAIVAKIANK